MLAEEADTQTTILPREKTLYRVSFLNVDFILLGTDLELHWKKF